MMIAVLSFVSGAWAQQPPADPEPAPTPVPENPEPFRIDFQPQAPQPEPVDPTVPLEPGAAPAAPVYSYDTVFMAPLQAYRPDLAPRAAQLTTLLNNTLSVQHDLIQIDQVPGWPDYSAEIYVLSCPEGQYSGCALVCGNRVDAQWTIGGTVSPGLQGGVNVQLVFIENQNAREVLSFGIALEGDDDRALVQGVNTVFAKILGGAFEQVDLRAVDTDPAERAKLDRAQREILAASLAEYEKQAGAVDRAEIDRGQLAQPKLSKDDIARMRVREEMKPWERLEMSEGEYRRYNNSGMQLQTWRKLRRGRLGQLVGRVSFGGGSGAYGQAMDSRYTLDDSLQRAGLEQFQYVSNQPHFDIDLAVGFGVLPWVDLTAHATYHRAPFTYFVNQERIGQPVVISENDFKRRSWGSWEIGGRANVVMMNISALRPTLHVGASYWQGGTWQDFLTGIDQLEPMSKLSVVFVHAGPGVEVTMGDNANLFLRGFADIPVAGTRQDSVEEGGGFLQEPADRTAFSLYGPGVSVQAGVVVRIPVVSRTEKRRSTMEFEEEEDF